LLEKKIPEYASEGIALKWTTFRKSYRQYDAYEFLNC
jgi:hypothetical protein